ncbi:MAG TPA: serine/threonine-protein kinase [Polyangium sp.]|nr:serine/threonine-protein kinase [Polyangium sp.]
MDTDDQAEESLSSGSVIADKYRVVRELGRGGMGVVVAATHIELDQRVAIKVLQRSVAYNQDALARFIREARAAAKIHSEHVARVMDVGKLEDGLTYIVMEYLEGSDLAAVLRKEGPLPITTAVDYVLQACEGIAAAHAAGIIHRDLKPANLFLARQPGRTNLVKILDFGVSKIARKNVGERKGGTTPLGMVFGSPMYMAPEQLDSAVSIDCRADIWALGVILFELLTGKPPFDGQSAAAIMAAVIRDPVPKLRTIRPDVPAALEEVLGRCLEKEREHRYATIIDLAEAIAPFCGKGADETVNRIYQILAEPGHHDPEAEQSTHGLDSAGTPKDSSGKQSDRRNLKAGRDSAEQSLRGASHTHGNALAKPHLRIVAGLAGVALVGFGAWLMQQRSSSAALTSPPISTSSRSEPTPSSFPTSSAIATASSESTKDKPASAEVTITFSDAPKDTKVFRGNAELGTVANPLRLPRSNDKITLRFVADTFAPAEVDLIPNVDQTVTITLKPAKSTTKRKVPKELEPF